MKFIAIRAKYAGILLGFLATAVAAVFGLSATGAYAVYFGGTTRSLPIYCVEREDKKIAISFDCAWGTEHTDDILKALKAASVPATFFMVEFWTERYPEYVKKIDEYGCEIGTHSATHSYMSKLSEEKIREELLSSTEAISAVTGKTVELFRAPYGDYDDLLIDTAADMGLYTIQWDVDSLDWKNISASDIAMRIINKVKSGSIILCHNNGLHTAEALPMIFDTLLKRGYTFVTIGDLIYRDGNRIDASGKQLKSSAAN